MVLTFFYKDHTLDSYVNKLNFLGFLHAAKQTALRFDGNAVEVLIRTGPHESTRVTLPGPTPTTVFQADACHITVDIKNAQMRKDGRHQTVHGYFTVRPAPGGITQLWDINVIDPKKGANGRPRVENDEYWEREKGEWKNEWKDIHKVDEPTELLQVHLGDSYVKILNNQLDGLDSQKRVREEQNAVKEVRDKLR